MRRLLVLCAALSGAACSSTTPTPFNTDSGTTNPPGGDDGSAPVTDAGEGGAATDAVVLVDSGPPDTGPLDCDPDPTKNCAAIDVSQVTPIVDSVVVGDAGSPPAMTGGTIVPGDYAQISGTFYVPNAGPIDTTPYQTIWRIATCNRVVFSMLVDGDSGPPIVTSTGGTFTVQSGTWTETGDCPDPNLAANVTYTYTATPTTLTFLETTKDGSHVMVFQKM